MTSIIIQSGKWGIAGWPEAYRNSSQSNNKHHHKAVLPNAVHKSWASRKTQGISSERSNNKHSPKHSMTVPCMKVSRTTSSRVESKSRSEVFRIARFELHRDIFKSSRASIVTKIEEGDLRVVWRGMIPTPIVLVHLAVPSQVGYHGEVAPTAFNFTSKWFLASMAVHVSLERAWSRESLVANFALVLLLGAGRDFGTELAHHRLWWWCGTDEVGWSRKRS